ncbi:unnamed protein product [Vitrella brassicaformis CCMP3155]|uniref:F5/8 type C domain-containing protein n=2 Tax=Vitrella brassicaformis TaxID=1169539 RepID=A0A0G4EIU5_VITBC|nr:unnamed protein product [Vitrella brassicaformis CCMP3155]|eukprot:CEL95918.1 unnamed protein product [Vitrella brassicaformis CCMP3155]
MAGLKVMMVSSMDDRHLPQMMTDGNERTFWISTGMYPQEILLELPQGQGGAKPPRGIQISSTGIRVLQVEASTGPAPINFERLQDVELPNRSGGLQTETIALAGGSWRYLRLRVARGWSDFCSVHKLLLML